MKTKTILSALYLFLIVLTAPRLNAQNASGNVITRDIQVDEFTGISLSEPVDYILIQGDKNLVKVETDDNLIDKVKTEVKNGILTVDTRSVMGASTLKVTIQAKDLKSIDISGAATLKSENTLKSPELKIDASGAADIKLEVETTDLESDLSGAASLKLSGMAAHHKVRASGAADLKAGDLQTSTTEVHMTGASNAKVEGKDKLSGSLSGISDLKYKNQPAVVDLDKSGNATNKIDSIIEKKEIIINEDNDESNNNDADSNEGEEHRDNHRNHEKGHGNFLMGKSNHTYIHWVGISTGINGYLDADNNFSTPAGYEFMQPDYGKSWFVDLNFLQYGLPIVKNYWHLVTGMGFQINNYVIEKDHILKPNTNYLDYSVDTTVSYKKNKLSDVYFQIPLLFQFDTPKVKKNNTFHLLFGVVGGIKVGAWTKQKYDNNDSKNFRTTRDDFNLAPFRWSAMVKLGYGPVNVFASYQLNQMFKPDHGPQLYPFTVGITLLGF